MYDIAIIDDEKWIRTLIKKLLPYDKYPIQVQGEAVDGKETGTGFNQYLEPVPKWPDIRSRLSKV